MFLFTLRRARSELRRLLEFGERTAGVHLRRQLLTDSRCSCRCACLRRPCVRRRSGASSCGVPYGRAVRTGPRRRLWDAQLREVRHRRAHRLTACRGRVRRRGVRPDVPGRRVLVVVVLSLSRGERVYRVSSSRVFAHVRTARDRGKLLAKGDIRVCPETDAEMGFRWSGVQIPPARPNQTTPDQ